MLLFLCHYTKNVEASSLTPTFIIEPKGMAFEVIPFCWIVKFSGITRFLYQFWKILPKYCGRKEKDNNILWSKWYSRREYFGLRPRADCVGTNRRALRGWSSPIEIPKAHPLQKQGVRLWYSRREYFGLRPRADCVGANRRSSCGRSSPIEIPRPRPCVGRGAALVLPAGIEPTTAP